MEITINHFINDVSIADLDRSIDISIDNEKTFPDGQGGFIGDYDYFYMMAEQGQSFKTLIEMGILSIDSDGTINAKCNYK
jgi:hypothetical protein